MIESPENESQWFPLVDRAVFRITGPDRVRFLNGQVTNDVSGPLDQESVAACLCTIKGKVEALVWISALGNSLILDGELKQREAIHARLGRYLIADDCEITDETGEIRIVHHFSKSSLVEGVRSNRLQRPGRDLFLNVENELPFEPEQIIPEEELRLLRLLSRIPEAGLEITGDEFPSELGLDARAVNFHKGCYLGQEIISRIESVGRVRRRLRVIQTDKWLPEGASVDNILGETGTTTRESIKASEKCFLTMAFFKLRHNSEETIDNEPVRLSPRPVSNLI